MAAGTRSLLARTPPRLPKQEVGSDRDRAGRQQGGTHVRIWNGTKGLQGPHSGGEPADPPAPARTPPRARRRRPLLALVALAAAAALAAGCSSSGSGSGGGGYGGAPSGTTTPSGGATVSSTSTKLGTILVDSSGRTLYLFEKDQPSQSACSGACVAAWPVDPSSGAPKAGSGVKASLLGMIKRSDGATQVTYNRHPLYYYAGDSGPGQQNGQGIDAFGAEWYVVTPAGKAVGG
jgi:predicted lipoprotein with Yx(FWY)xxD motif